MQPAWLWLALLPMCGIAAWLVICRPIRDFGESRDAARARESFRLQREVLELRFVVAIAHEDPVEGPRWDDADWQTEVVWARDRHSRHLLALVGVCFEDLGFGAQDFEHATAIFEYRDGQWHAEGRHVDALRPSEACLRHRQLEPIEPPYPGV